MIKKLHNGETVLLRPYEEADFPIIQAMNEAEGWHGLVARGEETRAAWRQSSVAYVAEVHGEAAAYVRGLTDGFITLYICELLVAKPYRGHGLGTALLQAVHDMYPSARMELLGSSTSHTYYKQLRFRPFYGFRKTKDE